MRITQGMMSDRLLSDIGTLSQSINKTQSQVSSGKRLQTASDDPIGAQRDVLTRAELAGTKRYQANVSQAQSWMGTTDAALGQVSDLVNRARDLAVQGASDSTGAAGRVAIAQEIDQIIDAVKAAGNTQFNGVYIFGGTATTTPPYTAGAGDTYAGDNGTVAREIGPGVSVAINTKLGTGTPPILGSGVAASDNGVLQSLRDLSTHLKANNSAALQGGDLKALDTNLDSLAAARAQVGATTNRLDAATARLGANEDTATQLLSDTEDTDFAQALLDLSNQQTVYSAALKTGATIIQPSLLDFLR